MTQVHNQLVPPGDVGTTQQSAAADWCECV